LLSQYLEPRYAARLLEDQTSLISPRKLPAQARLELSGVNGLNGKMAVKVRDVASWKLLGRVPAGEVNAKRQATEDQRKARLEEEEKRLEQERIKREERKKTEAQKSADARAKQQKQDSRRFLPRKSARPSEQSWRPVQVQPRTDLPRL
jgi:membrane protein involved in colicin uptake